MRLSSERRAECVHVCAPQILTRRLRFRLERAPGETALIDRTGRMLKMEPLATVESLEQYLLKMVSPPSTRARSCWLLTRLSSPPGGQAVVRL